MLLYPRLTSLVFTPNHFFVRESFRGRSDSLSYLVWLDDYDRSVPKNDIVETTAHGFSYTV